MTDYDQLPTLEWPDGTQDAMRLGPDWRQHALPQWSTRDFHSVAHSFAVAAEAVYESALRNSPDFVFLPLHYLWRQHLELLFKANLKIWSRLAGKPIPNVSRFGHNLPLLCEKFEELEDGIATADDREGTAHARSALETFLALGPHHDSSRYPVAKDGTPFERPERVDLTELHRAATAVSNLLSGAFDQADALLYAQPDY